MRKYFAVPGAVTGMETGAPVPVTGSSAANPVGEVFGSRLDFAGAEADERSQVAVVEHRLHGG